LGFLRDSSPDMGAYECDRSDVFQASDPDLNMSFGSAFGLDGDTLVVGAYQGSIEKERIPEGGTDQTGAAYVFTKSGTQWVQQQKLLPNNQRDPMWFGSSVD